MIHNDVYWDDTESETMLTANVGLSMVQVSELQDQWTATLRPDYGQQRDVYRTVGPFSTAEEAMDAGYNEARVFCQTCGVDTTMKGFVTGYISENGVTKVTNITCRECDRAARYAEYQKTGFISTSLLTTATIDNYRTQSEESVAVVTDMEKVTEAVALFESQVWFGGLQKYVRESAYKGASAEFGEVKFLSYTMCGRSRVTLQGSNGFVDVLVAEESTEKGMMGINGIGTTAKEAAALLLSAVTAWHRGEIKLKVDTQVSPI